MKYLKMLLLVAITVLTFGSTIAQTGKQKPQKKEQHIRRARQHKHRVRRHARRQHKMRQHARRRVRHQQKMHQKGKMAAKTQAPSKPRK
jgi:hypothetical protein